MRKLLSILSAVILTSSASTSIIACGSQEKPTVKTDLKTIVKNQNLGDIVISKKVVPDKKDILQAIIKKNAAGTLTENDFEFKPGCITPTSSVIIGMGKYQGEVKIEYKSINFNLVNAIPNAIIESLITDKAGNVYIGTNIGIFKNDKKTNLVTKILDVIAQIKNLLIDKDDNIYAGLWLGTESERSVFIYKKKKDEEKFAQSTPILGSVQDLAIDSKGTIYAVTNIGIYKTNDDKSAFIKIFSRYSSYFLTLVVDKNDNLYVGGYLGLFMKDKDQEKFTRKLWDEIFCLTSDKDGNVYGGSKVGVFKINGTNSFISLILGTSNVRSLAVAVNGTVYAGSADGSVYKSNGTSRFIFIFDLNDNIIVNSVRALAIDKDDNLYVGNTSGKLYKS